LSTDGIQREDFGSKGRYVLRRNGVEAEITFSVTTPKLIIADHTEVPAALRGTGAGAELVAFMVADMRTRGAKVMPLCPFVNAERKKHPEWADAFAA
jgi:predicted GNAT family acetyltransferase